MDRKIPMEKIIFGQNKKEKGIQVIRQADR